MQLKRRLFNVFLMMIRLPHLLVIKNSYQSSNSLLRCNKFLLNDPLSHSFGKKILRQEKSYIESNYRSLAEIFLYYVLTSAVNQILFQDVLFVLN